MTGARSVALRFAILAGVLGAFVFLNPSLATMLLAAVVFSAGMVTLLQTGKRVDRSDQNPEKAIGLNASTRAVAEAFGGPVYVLDMAGNLIYENRVARAEFGAKTIGNPLTYWFRQSDLATFLNGVIRSGQAASTHYHDKGAQERWFEIHAAPIRGESDTGAPAAYLVTFTDQTEIRRADRMRTDFVANASHELRTPLTSLRGFAETIKGSARLDPKATRKFLDVMLEQAERMSRLIDDLLSLSRVEMKEHRKPSEKVELSALLTNVIKGMEPLAGGLGVEISARLPSDPLVINGDMDELVQVFQNLIENACKYGQQGGKVEVSARYVAASNADVGCIEVAVRDWGPGIAGEHLPRLTERFYRVDVAKSRQGQGTGLGLAIVKHILNRHGTRLAIASRPGEGSTFSIRFPLPEENSLKKQ
ncbi:MAG: ATP-binding protein [Rhizobiaceae bacterium]